MLKQVSLAVKACSIRISVHFTKLTESWKRRVIGFVQLFNVADGFFKAHIFEHPDIVWCQRNEQRTVFLGLKILFVHPLTLCFENTGIQPALCIGAEPFKIPL